MYLCPLNRTKKENEADIYIHTPLDGSVLGRLCAAKGDVRQGRTRFRRGALVTYLTPLNFSLNFGATSRMDNVSGVVIRICGGFLSIFCL